MNTDRQVSDTQPIIGRIARLFYSEGCNTQEIARTIGWDESAVDRALARIVDARYGLLRRDAPGPLTLPVERQETVLTAGARVRYSPKAIDTLYMQNRHVRRIGTVIGPANYPNGDCIIIRWDGKKSTNRLHMTFLEIVPAEMGGEGQGA